MPTPTIHWAIDAAGDWATTADWNLHRLPNSADDVSINTTHIHTVTHSAGTDTVHTLTVGNDYFTVTGGKLTITSAASFAHQLKVSGGELSLGGDTTAVHLVQSDSILSGAGTLTVSGTGGPATFTSNLLQTGPGTTVLQGAATYDGANTNYFGIDGGRTLEIQGVFTLTGKANIELGFNPFGASLGGGTLKNDAGATIDIQGANQIRFIVGPGVTRFINAGALEKTVGTGLSAIGVDTKDSGSIKAASGTLWFFEPITGAGSMAVDAGATLRVDASAASTLKMTFNGGTLALSDPASFAAAIHAFGAGDTIDLRGRTATKATLGAGDTLVIKNGTTTLATLQLAGNHAGDTFHVASDGHGGTDITVTAAASASPPAHHQFIAAMAGMGDSGAVAIHGRECWAAPAPMLGKPRAMIA